MAEHQTWEQTLSSPSLFHEKIRSGSMNEDDERGSDEGEGDETIILPEQNSERTIVDASN